MKSRFSKFFGIILIIILAANLVMMAIFTINVNSKLSEALKLSKPQEGSLTLISASDCAKCSVESVKKQLIELNTEFTEEKTLTENDSGAKDLINSLNIEKLPALVFKSDRKIKTSVKQILESKGWEIKANLAVWKNNPPPYYDLKAKESIGLVDAIFLTDKNCKDCYDAVTVHKSLLNNFKVTLNSEKTLDISDPEGKKLLTKYSIKAVPTAIFSKELKVYEKLSQVWEQAGSVEKDGSFVFRNLDLLKVKYKTLP